VERYLAPDIWHNVASPVSSEHSDCFIGTDLVFWYNETLIWNDWNFGWVWYTGATGGPLMVFRGYDVYFQTNPVTVDYMATGAETLNTGSYNYNVTITDPAPNPMEIPSHMGWNFAGNPYPSPVDWLASGGWDKSDINDAKYIWDGTNNIYTIFLGGGSPIGINGGTRFIPSNQGFWVQAVQNGSVSINNSTRLGDMTGTPDFYKITPPDYPLISLIASGNNKQDEVMIRFIEGTTGRFDINYDASKLYSFTEDVPQLAIMNGKQALAISSLPEMKDNQFVTLDFQCGTAGYYQIEISERTELDSDVKLYLQDLLSISFTELEKNLPYNFYHNPADNKNRFRLYFNPSAETILDGGNESHFSVYTARNTIKIIKNTAEDLSGQLFICTLTGQEIYQQTIINNPESTITVTFPTGYYILYIVTNQFVYNKKILLIN
jgi:hypothetical protein